MVGEQLVLVDEPATSAFLYEATNELLIIALIALVTGFVVGNGGGRVAAGIGAVIIAAVSAKLVVSRLRAWYTRYALTDFRLIRSSGVINRELAWMPWSKVTDVLLVQTLPGRLLGYATVRIESANELSGFKAVTDLRDPHRFHRVVTEMVQAKQGKTVPPWMRPDAPGPAPGPPGPGRGPGPSGPPGSGGSSGFERFRRRPGPGPGPGDPVTVPAVPVIPLPGGDVDPFDD